MLEKAEFWYEDDVFVTRALLLYNGALKYSFNFPDL